jgi:hypothetical protein
MAWITLVIVAVAILVVVSLVGAVQIYLDLTFD